MPKQSAQTDSYDVLIAGGGIIAATFARILAEQGRSVVMIDAGAQHSRRIGENLKNFPTYQVDVDQFGGIVEGLMHPVSIPPAGGRAYTRNALNPRQRPELNLPGAVAAYAVGGMAIHWTCAIPRHHPTLERISFISANEWDDLYSNAETRLNRHTDVFSSSLRHQVIQKHLTNHGYPVENTPLAAERSSDNARFVRFTGADTVLGPFADANTAASNLTLLQEHRVSELRHRSGRVHSAVVRDLRSREEREIKADVFVVAAGWVHTPQILWNSKIHSESGSALGCYLSDHTFTACQIVLKDEILQEIAAAGGTNASKESSWTPIPIPMEDPPPHLYLPVANGRPWHGQIFREAFQFDPLAPNVDTRLIVDLKWFGMIDPVPTNRVTFESDIHDRIGMPQPTFHFQLGEDDKKREHEMLMHMQEVACTLGDYLPGSLPRRIPLGASTHTMGATRMGPEQDGGKTSVVDPNSKVWGFENLYLGGNCVIPTANASNPTLTSVALAVRASRHLSGTQTAGSISSAVAHDE